MKLKVLLIGNGGRESAIAWKIKQSSMLAELKVFPGNGGFSKDEILPVGSVDIKNKFSVQKFVEKEKFDLVIVGPEDPLVDGIADWLSEIHIPCFGPSAYCAQLEGSKDFAKSLMQEFGVPTAKHHTFIDYEDAKEFISKNPAPIVVKADGLAAGKGVAVCKTREEALSFLSEIFVSHKFGKSGSKVVIEEFMDGEEASIFGICDGDKTLLFPAAQDHKRAFDNDEGPNTGGMGAYAPAPIVTKEIRQIVLEQIFKPMLEGLKKKGHSYRGLLYAGLMILKTGEVKVVEFNCRFGDPETQALLLVLEDDLLELMYDSSLGCLKKEELTIKKGFSSVVVLAAKGYPENYEKGLLLKFPSGTDKDVHIFHAGTAVSRDEQLKSNGGRIAGVSALGDTLKESLGKAYEVIHLISTENTFYRSDIGKRALK